MRPLSAEVSDDLGAYGTPTSAYSTNHNEFQHWTELVRDCKAVRRAGRE